MVEDAEKEKRSPYCLNLVPGEEQRRLQWNMILISDIPVTVDFFHTDMLEKVVSIKGADLAVKKEEEPIG